MSEISVVEVTSSCTDATPTGWVMMPVSEGTAVCVRTTSRHNSVSLKKGDGNSSTLTVRSRGQIETFEIPH